MNKTLIIDTLQREEEERGKVGRGFTLKRKCRRVAAMNRSGGTRHGHGWLRQG